MNKNQIEKSEATNAFEIAVKNLIQKKYGIPFEEAYGDLFDEWISSELSFNDNDVEVVVDNITTSKKRHRSRPWLSAGNLPACAVGAAGAGKLVGRWLKVIVFDGQRAAVANIPVNLGDAVVAVSGARNGCKVVVERCRKADDRIWPEVLQQRLGERIHRDTEFIH